MKLLQILSDKINAFLDAYEQSMNEWHETDPEGYYNYTLRVTYHD